MVNNNSSKLSKIRNDLIHEAIYDSEPLGFKSIKENLSFYLTRINERILLLILGVESSSLQSEIHRFQYILRLNN